MSKKAILNITSRKKKDVMQPVSFNSPTGLPTNNATFGSPAAVQGGRVNMFYWCPTARDLTINNGNIGSAAQEATRTSTTVYMRLLSERIRLQTNSSVPWVWRRIVFTAKGESFRPEPAETGAPSRRAPYIESSQGIGRLLQQFDSAGGLGNTQAEILSMVFRGTSGIDWSDPMIAPVDPLRVTVKYDKTTTLIPQTASGYIRETRRTHYFNKNLVYDDDESGDVMTTNPYSVESKAGMGDAYVIDFFRAGTNGTASDLLIFAPESTLYWHEK